MSPAEGRDTVLIIEDEAEVRRPLAKLLRSEGFAVLEAHDGSEAVHLFADHAGRIAAVTLDLMMPTTDGRETLAMLSAFAPGVPIVILTAFDLPDTLLGRVPGTRGVAYVQKPYEAAELTGAIRRVIAEMQPPA